MDAWVRDLQVWAWQRELRYHCPEHRGLSAHAAVFDHLCTYYQGRGAADWLVRAHRGTVVALRLRNGLTIREIASALGWSEDTIKDDVKVLKRVYGIGGRLRRRRAT
jgi:DNA-binding CsgD family transcriptional regulator